MKPTIHGTWHQRETFGTSAIKFTCGYCGTLASANDGYYTTERNSKQQIVRAGSFIVFCPSCRAPTLRDNSGKNQFPPPLLGRTIAGVPGSVGTLYDEARACNTAGSPTGCTSVCRILLMHVAADVKKQKPANYQQAVEWLVEAGEITRKQAEWVHHVRREGNDANHELDPVSEADAERVLMLVETLLVTMYEAPARIATAKP